MDVPQSLKQYVLTEEALKTFQEEIDAFCDRQVKKNPQKRKRVEIKQEKISGARKKRKVQLPDSILPVDPSEIVGPPMDLPSVIPPAILFPAMPMPDLEKPNQKPPFDLADILSNDLDLPPQKKKSQNKKKRKPKNKQGKRSNCKIFDIRPKKGENPRKKRKSTTKLTDKELEELLG